MDIQKSLELEKKALETCNSEPIEFIGSVQDFGILVAIDSQYEIIYISENAKEILSIPAEELIGKKIDSVFSSQQIHDLKNTIGQSSVEHQREFVAPFSLNKNNFYTTVYRNKDLFVIELIKDPQFKNHEYSVIENVRHILAKISFHKDPYELLHNAAEELRALSRFDRVMVYEFKNDMSGEVIYESKNSFLDPFLNLRFPAWDIPPRARDLFLKTPIRYIESISQQDHRILSKKKMTEPLDLSLSMLRSVPEVHKQYLENMGVYTSITLPIVVDGKLWGLFASHNYSETKVDPATLIVYEIAGKSISLSLEQSLKSEQNKRINSLLKTEELIEISEENEIEAQHLINVENQLKKIIKFDGITYVYNNAISKRGSCPTNEIIKQILNRDILDPQIEYTNNLADFYPYLTSEEAAGFLHLKINSEGPQLSILLFRKELEKIISWSGNPEKEIEVTKLGIRLHPRSSFEHYKETVKGQSEDWTKADLELATQLCLHLSKVLTAKLNRQANDLIIKQRLKLAVSEMNHRVRNLLALVTSISRQSMESTDSIEQYVESLAKRISSLADTNSILMDAKDYSRISLSTLIEKEVRPYRDSLNKNERIELNGPKVLVNSSLAPVLTLVIHELTTNSAKYGALSVKSGKVVVNWSIQSDKFSLFWKELGGPSILKAPQKEGFGTSIIKNALEYEFEAKTTIKFRREGLEVHIKMPLYNVIHPDDEVHEIETPTQVRSQKGQAEKIDTEIKSVLILEDNFILAQELKASLSQLLNCQVEIAANIKSAENLIHHTKFDLCFLDVNLRTETSLKIAELLKEKNILFVYCTGYGSGPSDLENFPTAPILQKPITAVVLSSFLKEKA